MSNSSSSTTRTQTAVPNPVVGLNSISHPSESDEINIDQDSNIEVLRNQLTFIELIGSMSAKVLEEFLTNFVFQADIFEKSVEETYKLEERMAMKSESTVSSFSAGTNTAKSKAAITKHHFPRGSPEQIEAEKRRLFSLNLKNVKLLVHPDKCSLDGSKLAFQQLSDAFHKK